MPGGRAASDVDLSGPRFTDSASVRALVLAGPDLKERDETMMLRPQPAAQRVLILTGADAGADQLIAIPERTCTEPEPEGP
jgi:anti-anti-sigma regulatory factor